MGFWMMSKLPPISEIITLSGKVHSHLFFLAENIRNVRKLVSQLTSEAGM